MTARHDKATCTGAGDCSAEAHIHGCFADRGNCDHPSEHRHDKATATLEDKLAVMAHKMTDEEIRDAKERIRGNPKHAGSQARRLSAGESLALAALVAEETRRAGQ